MSFLQRSASLAAACLCLLGLGSPGQAAESASTGTVAVTKTAGSVMGDTLVTPTGDVIPVPATATFGAPAAAAAAAATPEAVSPHFASLEDAVAAQGEGASPSDEIACLAGAIYYEAKGEPLSGQLAVANVIINRVRSGRFPSDVCGVVTQRGQFSFVRDGHVPAIDAGIRAYRTAAAVARVALAHVWNSPAPDALFFHARRVGVGHGVQVAAIGNHVFYR